MNFPFKFSVKQAFKLFLYINKKLPDLKHCFRQPTVLLATMKHAHTCNISVRKVSFSQVNCWTRIVLSKKKIRVWYDYCIFYLRN